MVALDYIGRAGAADRRGQTERPEDPLTEQVRVRPARRPLRDDSDSQEGWTGVAELRARLELKRRPQHELEPVVPGPRHGRIHARHLVPVTNPRAVAQ